MFLERHYQNAYVTRDLDRAIESLQTQYGVGDFNVLETDMKVTTPRGRGRSASRVALRWIGSFQIELIEPVSGLVDIYRDFLPEDPDDYRPRFHHICMRTDDWDTLREEIDRRGWTVSYGLELDEMKFAYVDARERLGHYLEYFWATPGAWKALGWPSERSD